MIEEGNAGAAPAPGFGTRRMSALKRYVVGQFGHPSGLPGVLAGLIMAQRDSNRRRNRWAVDLMGLRPGMRVLELGHGPGFALARVGGAIAPHGRAIGVEHSVAMSRMAARRNRRAIDLGTLKLVVASADAPDLVRADPALDEPFDRIFAVNVVMFWSDPVAAYRRLRSMLAEGGALYVMSQPRVADVSDEGAVAAARATERHMRAAGLGGIRVETFAGVSPVAVCVVGGRD